MTTLPIFKMPHVVSALLPPDARAQLARAAFEAKQMVDELAREVHVNNAIRRVRLQYPEFFKE